MTHPVVVGVDGSPSSLAAVETAAREAERRGTGLRLAHALVWPSTHVTPGVPPWDPDGAGMRDQVDGPLAEAERRARRVAPGVEITRDVLAGEPAIVLEAESRTASLTVVGGCRPGLPHASVAGQLTAHGSSPVLVVRGAPDRTGPVVLATPAAAEAARFAFAEAARRGADLVVVHTGPHRLPAGLRETYPQVTVRDLRIRGRSGPALVRASAHAQLIVVGARRRGPALLRHAHCSVAVVPADRT